MEPAFEIGSLKASVCCKKWWDITNGHITNQDEKEGILAWRDWTLKIFR